MNEEPMSGERERRRQRATHLVGRRLETAPSEGNKPSKGLLRAGDPSRGPCEVEVVVVVGDTLSA